MKWRPFTHQGTIYHLSHLDPFKWNYTATEARDGQSETTCKFQVVFSMHCFTRNPLSDEQVAEDLWYPGPREKRVFCFERYELSRHLPEIIRTLGERDCWHAGHSDFLTIELTTREGKVVEYEVYFRVIRISGQKRLNLTIQSAYIRTKDRKATRPRRKRIRFDVIARNRQLGRRIHPGR